MRYLVLLALLCRAVSGIEISEYADALKQELYKVQDECATKHETSAADIDLIRKGQTPESKEGKCVVACTFKHFGLVKDDGKINRGVKIERMEDFKDLDEDIYNKMLSGWNVCTEKVSDDDDECNTSADLISCMRIEAGKVGIREILGI